MMLWGDSPHRADNKSLLIIRHLEYNLTNNPDILEYKLEYSKSYNIQYTNSNIRHFTQNVFK